MTGWLRQIMLYATLSTLVLLWGGEHLVAQSTPGIAPEARDMRLVGYNDLQSRSA